MRVLVIEDEAVIGVLLTLMLTAQGHEVIGVEVTEAAAVQRAAVTRPELILADEQLLEGSGRAAVQQILRDGFIPHLWMSGHPLPDTDLAPGVGVLRKPFGESELIAAIARVLAALGDAPAASGDAPAASGNPPAASGRLPDGA